MTLQIWLIIMSFGHPLVVRFGAKPCEMTRDIDTMQNSRQQEKMNSAYQGRTDDFSVKSTAPTFLIPTRDKP